MRKRWRKGKCLLLAIVMILLGTGIFGLEAKATGTGATGARQGTVYVEFYLKGAYYGATDGQNIKQLTDATDGGWSSGSGFFVGKPGEDPMYIVTNFHVVDDYVATGEGGRGYITTNRTWTQENGATFPVNVYFESSEMRIYYDDDNYDVAYMSSDGGSVDRIDLAVLKLRNATKERKALAIQVPDQEMVGDTVYSIGYPGNADNDFMSASRHGLNDMTMRDGIISKIGANAQGIERIQMTAVIQHGNSGGPLVTENGDVVGVNTNGVMKGGEMEVDYYAISASELVTFLDRNNIPYTMASQKGGGSSLMWIIVIALMVIVVAAVVAVFFLKGKNVMSGAGKTQKEGKASAPASSQTAQRAFIRSMAVQHNGMALVVGATPLLIGRDPANCKLVYVEGTTGVSGRHCSISYDASTGEFILTDLRSTYGTFLLGGQKLNANVPYRLKPGESFYVGDKANLIRAELG